MRFKIGDRVQLHPATDAWMRGDRYGTIVTVQINGFYRIRLDHSNRIVRFPESDVLEKVS